jgi:hypothetical protein
VRAALELPPEAPIPEERLATVTKLSFHGELEFDSTGLLLLSGLTHLCFLSLHGSGVLHLSPLKALNRLQTLFVANTRVSDDQVTQLQRALPDLQIVR